MRTRPILPSILLFSLATLSGCGDGTGTPSAGPGPSPATALVPTASQPDHVAVDHILIGVRQPSPRMAGFKRNAEEAKAVAYDLFKKLKAGADWAAAKREFSEDPPPGGPYSLANSSRGVQPASADEFPRANMATSFGDVGFSLQVGDIGIAEFDPDNGPRPGKSPFGYHIIKRVR